MRALVRTWRYLEWKHLAVAIAAGILIAASVSLSTLQLNLFRKHLEFVNLIPWYLSFAAVFIAGIAIVEANAPRRRPPLRSYVVVALVASTICMAGAYVVGPSLKMGKREVPGFPNPKNYQADHARPTAIFSIGFEGVMHCVIGMFVYVRLRNARFTARALQRTQARANEAARAAASARLESVRDRIDPASLTQTLEDIEHLYWTDPSGAEARLDELIEFLRAAIPKTRGEEWSAARETVVQAAE